LKHTSRNISRNSSQSFFRDDRFASANLGFELFEPSPFPERDHDDGLLAISLDHERPVSFGDVLVKESQRIAKMCDRDRRVFKVAFIHELAQNSDMYNNETLLMTAAVPAGLFEKRIFLGVPKTFSVGVSMMRKRRPFHFTSFSLPGGVSYAASPIRKPYTRKGKKALFTQDDPDLVSQEFESSLDEYEAYPAEAKQRFLPVLANRINTRRALRELVLPEIAALADTLQRIERRLDAIERSVGNGEAS